MGDEANKMQSNGVRRRSEERQSALDACELSSTLLANSQMASSLERKILHEISGVLADIGLVPRVHEARQGHEFEHST
jgi:hypothetical protein